MNILSFEYVLALSQAETIRQAAERLYISPRPSVSTWASWSGSWTCPCSVGPPP